MNRRDDLRGVFARHAGPIALGLALLLVTLLAGTGLLGLSGHFLTAAALAGGAAAGFNFFGPSAGIRALTFARILSRYGEKLAGHDATLRVARDLRAWFFRRALPLAPLGLGRFRTGDLLARLMADIDAVDGLLVRALGPLLALSALALLASLAAFAVLPAAGLLLLGALAALGVAIPRLTLRGLAADEAARAQARGELRAAVQEGLEGATDLTAMDAAVRWLDALDARSAAVAAREEHAKRRLAAGAAAHAVAVALVLPAMLWLLLSAVHAGRIAAAAAGGIFFMTVAVLETAAGIALAWQAWQAARASAQRLESVVGIPSAVADTGRAALPADGELRLAAVAFRWPGAAREVLSDVSLVLRPGERIAVRGDSGQGKSTLLALLLRLCDPDRGQASFGGVDLRQAPLAQWHARIAWLPQEAPVFSGSVRDNLRLGDPGADDARLWRALAQVKLDARFREETDGLDAWVGENGATLSAGQARRLALARALLRDAPLVLLDEPTEGLDQDTADALMHDVAAACAGRSLLVISHAALPPGVVQRHYQLADGRLAEAAPGAA